MPTNIERKIDKLTVMVEKHGELIKQNSKSIDELTVKVAGNSEDIKQLVTKVGGNSESITSLNQTVDDLAMSVKRGFDAVYEKFDQMDTRMDGMITIAVFNERMDRVEFHKNEHDRRLDNLEDKVGLISRKIGLSRK